MYVYGYELGQSVCMFMGDGDDRYAYTYQSQSKESMSIPKHITHCCAASVHFREKNLYEFCFPCYELGKT